MENEIKEEIIGGDLPENTPIDGTGLEVAGAVEVGELVEDVKVLEENKKEEE